MAKRKKKEKQSPAEALKVAFAELGEILGEVKAHTADVEDETGASADDGTKILSATRATEIARLVFRLRVVINTLERPQKDLTKAIREYVKANPTGWIHAATVEKQFLCWVAPDGKIKVILVDSPTHELPVDDLLALVGLKGALTFLKTDYTAVCKAAEGGTLKDADGKVVPLEAILKRRVRKAREKRVDVDSLDPADAAPLVAVIDPEIARQRLEDLESLGLTAATITALGKNGIKTAWDLRHLSGEEIAALDGIGPVRAAEIMAAIIKRAK